MLKLKRHVFRSCFKIAKVAVRALVFGSTSGLTSGLKGKAFDAIFQNGTRLQLARLLLAKLSRKESFFRVTRALVAFAVAISRTNFAVVRRNTLIDVIFAFARFASPTWIAKTLSAPKISLHFAVYFG